jgi:hypothetical protein
MRLSRDERNGGMPSQGTLHYSHLRGYAKQSCFSNRTSFEFHKLRNLGNLTFTIFVADFAVQFPDPQKGTDDR